MKLLLHTCCAPCSVKCIEILRESNIDLTAFWYNPNIHPWTEYNIRKNTLLKYCEKNNLDVSIKDEYGLRDFVCGVYPDFSQKRCKFCYELRMGETAKHALKDGYDGFSTTLLISPYQKHDMIKEIGENLATKYKIKFHYIDFRPYFRSGQQIARKAGLYMQKYCGCIFSEEERYVKSFRKKAKD